jgi:hypothetical protein
VPPQEGFDLRRFSIASRLHVSPAIAWHHAVSPEGVNREFRPLLRMTFPPNTLDLTASWRPGERRFRSWLLLGGFLPVDYDDVTFVEVERGRRFVERSTLLSQRTWQHERVIEADERGCVLTDRVAFLPRVRILGAIHLLVFRAVFRLRHRNLQRDFGGRAAV